MNEREVRERRERLERERDRAGATACNEAAKAQEIEERASALREHARVASKQLKDLAAYQDGLAAEHRDAERSARDRYDALSAELREFMSGITRSLAITSPSLTCWPASL